MMLVFVSLARKSEGDVASVLRRGSLEESRRWQALGSCGAITRIISSQSRAGAWRRWSVRDWHSEMRNLLRGRHGCITKTELGSRLQLRHYLDTMEM